MSLNENINPLDVCRCDTPDADGFYHTCWLHHNCSDGSCTHGDGDDE